MSESYFNEVTDLTWRFATLLKRNSNTGAFLLIFRNFFRKRPAGVSEYSVCYYHIKYLTHSKQQLAAENQAHRY